MDRIPQTFSYYQHTMRRLLVPEVLKHSFQSKNVSSSIVDIDINELLNECFIITDRFQKHPSYKQVWVYCHSK